MTLQRSGRSLISCDLSNDDFSWASWSILMQSLATECSRIAGARTHVSLSLTRGCIYQSEAESRPRSAFPDPAVHLGQVETPQCQRMRSPACLFCDWESTAETPRLIFLPLSEQCHRSCCGTLCSGRNYDYAITRLSKYCRGFGCECLRSVDS